MKQRELLLDNILVRIHFIIVIIRWIGLAPWELAFPFTGGFTSTVLVMFDLECGLDDRCLPLFVLGRPQVHLILYEKGFKLKLSGNEVYYTTFP